MSVFDMKSMKSFAMSLNVGLSFKNSFVSPCIFTAFASMLCWGFMCAWNVFSVIVPFIISTHPISTMR